MLLMCPIRRLQMYIKFPNRLCGIIAVFVICFCCISNGAAQNAKSNIIKLGYINLETVRASAEQGKSAEFIGGVVVRIFNNSKNESFVITNRYGKSFMPLRQGSYCAEAFGTKGQKLKLDSFNNGGAPVCFILKAQEILDVGIVLASDEQYKPELPKAELN